MTGQGIQLAPGCTIPARYLTRHVGVFGATGTGKTTTAAAIVERAPCPVLVLDAKGDLESLGRVYRPWDAQLNLSELGPDLVARALDLSEPQAGALQVAFAWADDQRRPVASLGDLRALLGDVVARADDLSAAYGLVSPSSVAAVQRALLRLERAAPWAFGPASVDWRDVQGVAVLALGTVAGIPGLYGATVAYILDSVYRGLGELGDVAAPGLLIMIDESHLVFDGAPVPIVRRIEQVTRLIRSKGVGLIYVTQSPADLPDAIAGQLVTRIQHGLRAATARQQKGLRAAAETMPGNVTSQDVMQLGTGQAIVSVPDARGVPQPGRVVEVQRGRVHLVAGATVAPPIFPAAARFLCQAEPAAVAAAPPRPWPWWKAAAVVGVLAYGLTILVSHLP